MPPHPTDVVAYTYDAGTHCVSCAIDEFGPGEDGVEGADLAVHAVLADSDAAAAGLSCDDCLRTITPRPVRSLREYVDAQVASGRFVDDEHPSHGEHHFFVCDTCREAIAEGMAPEQTPCVRARINNPNWRHPSDPGLFVPAETPLQTRCGSCWTPLPQTTEFFYRYPNGRWATRCRDCERERHRAARPVKNRRYGVEIEALFGGYDEDDIDMQMQDHGLHTSYDGYSHRHTSGHTWLLTTDGSLNGNGYELVSPPMRNPDGRRQIESACAAARALDADTNSSCGLHVHHEVGDLNARAFGRLLRFYHDGQDAIDELVSSSRRHNDGYAARLPEGIVAECERMRDLQDGTLERWGRYYVLNPSSYPKYGTIEFRQHQGTLDAEKINTWVEFGQAMITWAKTERARYVNMSLDAVLEQLMDFGGLEVRTAEYLKARAARLARRRAYA